MLKLFPTLKQKVLQKKIKAGMRDIAEAEVFIAYYESCRDEMNDDKEIAAMDLKIGQLKKSIGDNLKFIDYAKSL